MSPATATATAAWLDEDQAPSSGIAPSALHARSAPYLPDYTYTGPVPPRHARGSRVGLDSVAAAVGSIHVLGPDATVGDERRGTRCGRVALTTLVPSFVIGGVPDPTAEGLALPRPLPEGFHHVPPPGVEVPDWVRDQVHRLWAVARTAPDAMGGVPAADDAGLSLPEPASDGAPIHHRAMLRLVLPGSELADVVGRHGVFDPAPRPIMAHLVVAPTHAAPQRIVAPTTRTARPKRIPEPPAPLRPSLRRSPWWHATAGGLALAIGVPAAAMIAPTALGGATSWTIVVGHSMEPTLDPGDLVFTRAQDHYGVGDVVVYTIPEGTAGAGVMIIHRIVGGDAEDGFITQGDNRDRPDPWRPTPELIPGRHWRTIDGGGNVVVWLRSPLAMAALLGATAFVGTLEMARKVEEEERLAAEEAELMSGGDA